jgi:oligopeptide transport system ATP-binding protein
VSELLEVERLTVQLGPSSRRLTPVNSISYAVEEGQFFGIAGESGSGKTLSALAVLGLLPIGASVSGTARFENRDLLRLGRRELRRTRGREIAIVFQDPMTSLHPMLSIGRQMTEHLRLHLGVSRRAAMSRAAELLERVRIPDPEEALGMFPHQFSGGMRQRIAIASALVCGPRLLIADEPTTALDVTVQAEILRLLSRLRDEMGLTLILITHDLGVMSSVADWVTVFYAGRIVESGKASDILQRPRHPYTQGLLAALPHPELTASTRLESIPGMPPSLEAIPAGCAFHPRCRFTVEACRLQIPALRPIGSRRLACDVDPSGKAP